MINPTVPPQDHDSDMPPASPLPTVDELIRQCPVFSRLEAAMAIQFVRMREANPHGRSLYISRIIDYSQEGYTWMQIWLSLMTDWLHLVETGDCEFMLEEGSLVHAVRHSLPSSDLD